MAKPLRSDTNRTASRTARAVSLGVVLCASVCACSASATYRTSFPEPPEIDSGTVLMVVSAAPRQALADGSTRATGYFLNELYEPYVALVRAGYRVAIATPGGRRPALDPESLDDKYWPSEAELARARQFAATAPAMLAPLALEELASRVDEFQGIIVPGGQGVMVDLLDNPELHGLLVAFSRTERPVGLICHAPAILTRLPAGSRVRPRARVTSVSRIEEWYIETFVMGAKAQVRRIGSSLEDAGYRHASRLPGRAHAVRDCNLVTSQNPFSSQAFSQHYLAALRDYRRGGKCVATR